MSSVHLDAAKDCNGASSGPLMARCGAPVVRGTSAPVPPEKASEPPPAAASALDTAAEAGRSERGESWALCSALLAVAIGWLAWSQPAPSARTVLFVALCLALVTIEYRRAGARFRSALVAAGVAQGLPAGEAAREAWRHDAAFLAERAAGQSAAGDDAQRG